MRINRPRPALTTTAPPAARHSTAGVSTVEAQRVRAQLGIAHNTSADVDGYQSAPLDAAKAIGSVRARAIHPPQAFEGLFQALAFGDHAILGLVRGAVSGSPLSRLLVGLEPPERFPPTKATTAALLLRLLWRYQDGAGNVDVDRLAADVGPQGAELARALQALNRVTPPQRPNYVFMAEVVDSLTTLVGPAEAKPLVDALVRNDALIPKTIAPLDAVLARVPNDLHRGKALIAAQHLLTNTVPLLEAFVQKGMRPQDIRVCGTPYNNNPLVVSYLKMLGMHVQPGHDSGGATRSLKEEKLCHLQAFVDDAVNHYRTQPPPNGFIVLDDGGLLHRRLHTSAQSVAPDVAVAPARSGLSINRPVHVEKGMSVKDILTGMERPSSWQHMLSRLEVEQSSSDTQHKKELNVRLLLHKKNTLVIEQTTRGITELQLTGLGFHTVAVAKAEGKRREGAVIGWALADATVHALAQRGLIGKAHNVVLVGGGTVGLEAARQLRDAGFEVTIVDIDQGRRREAADAGFRTGDDVSALLPTTDVVLSCTGKNVLSGEQLRSFSGLLLSGSSMAQEFDVDQINAYRAVPIDVANRGRPVNFYGDGHALLSHNEIGITIALLFLGSCKSIPESDPALHDVDTQLQQVALESWERSGGTTTRKIETTSKSTPRPDQVSTDGSGTHEDWMSWLSSRRSPVVPPPNTSRRAPGQYFFLDDDGTVRLVNTARGTSRVVPLPAAPDRVIALGRPEPAACEVVVDGKRQLFLLTGLNGDVQAEALGTVTRRVCARPRDRGADIAYETPTGLLVRTVTGQLKHFSCSPHPDAMYVWSAFGDIKRFIAPSPAAEKFVVGEHPDLSLDVKLPLDRLDTITAVGWTKLALGSREGNTVVASFDRPSSMATLPAGATFRGVRPTDDGNSRFVIVDYTLSTDPIEIENYRQFLLEC
jgi:S-adenosylhomocysteine hydrolase